MASVISYSKALIDQLLTAAKNRANHTGTQLASSISDLATAVDARTAQLGVPATPLSLAGTVLNGSVTTLFDAQYYNQTEGAALAARVLALENSSGSGVTAPNAPTIGAVTAGVNSVSVAFTPSGTGSAATSFVVTLSSGQTATVTSSPAVISNLPSGQAVTATVRAQNSAGFSSASAASGSATPTAAASAPNAPTIGTIVAGQNQITVPFTPSASGSTASSYTAIASSGQTATGTSSPIVIGGLTGGISVSATVSASNAAGTSALSAASNLVAPTAAAVTVTASNRGRLAYGTAPNVVVLGETGVPQGSSTLTAFWTPTTADTAARTTPTTMGVGQQAQTAYQVQVFAANATAAGPTGSVLYDTGTVASAAESAVVAYSGTAATRYWIQVRVRQTDNQWSAYEGTRFAWPSGTTRYIETYGAVGDGVHLDGADYNNYGGGGNIYTGPIRDAMKASGVGDLVTMQAANKATVLLGISVAGSTITSGTSVFTSAMVSKNVMVMGAGPWDATGLSTLRTTIKAVAADGKSATLSAAASSVVASTWVSIGYKTYLTGHIDIDGNTGSGGFTFDGGGNLFISNDPDSAGFHISRLDVTIQNVVYEHRNVVKRGTGQNQNSGTFEVQDGSGAATGFRWKRCVSIHARDAAFMVRGTNSTDGHVLDCVVDHSQADAYHVTNSASRVRFGRSIAYYPGDDAFANIGYYNDGLSQRPHHIWWYDMVLHGQDWGRGISFGGCTDILATNIVLDGTAGPAVLEGSDGDQSQSERCQIVGMTITRPNYRSGLKPTYSQGATTTSQIESGAAWVKLLTGHQLTQTGLLMENVTVNDGDFMQIIQGGTSFFDDLSTIMRAVTMTGLVNAGTNWLDDYTYQYHIDVSGISVPSGSTNLPASRAVNAGSTTAGFH